MKQMAHELAKLKVEGEERDKDRQERDKDRALEKEKLRMILQSVDKGKIDAGEVADAISAATGQKVLSLENDITSTPSSVGSETAKEI